MERPGPEDRPREFDKRLEKHYRSNFDGLVKGYTVQCGSKARAEDAIQEGYARALKYFYTFDEDRSFDDWMFIVIKNAFKRLSVRERQQWMVMEKAADGIQPDDQFIDSPVEARSELRDIERRIKAKPSAEKHILWLYLIKQLTQQEVAMLVPESQPTIHRVVKAFRQELKDRDNDEPKEVV